MYNCFFVHGFLLRSLLYVVSVVLVPIIKDKCGKINSKDNYRPIALATIVSKIVENILLDRMSVTLSTMSNQFGFKKRHRRVYGSMFTCFLDASKVFDRPISYFASMPQR